MPTIGALKARGWHGLRIHCRSCNEIHVLIWARLKQPDEREAEDIASRLRCQKCGTRPEPADVTPYRLDTARP